GGAERARLEGIPRFVEVSERRLGDLGHDVRGGALPARRDLGSHARPLRVRRPLVTDRRNVQIPCSSEERAAPVQLRTCGHDQPQGPGFPATDSAGIRYYPLAADGDGKAKGPTDPRPSVLPGVREHQPGPASALDRSTSNSTATSSRSLSAPKKPVYGLIPNADWTSVAVPRYRPGPGTVTCSRAGWVFPFRVAVPSIAPPLAPEAMIRDEAKVAVAPPRMFSICFLIWARSPSVSGLAPPVPSRTSSEPRSRSAVTVAAVRPPSSSAGTWTRADHRVTSMVRSWPAFAASPARPVLMTTRPVSGPSRKLPVFAVTGLTVGGHAGKGLLLVPEWCGISPIVFVSGENNFPGQGDNY